LRSALSQGPSSGFRVGRGSTRLAFCSRPWGRLPRLRNHQGAGQRIDVSNPLLRPSVVCCSPDSSNGNGHHESNVDLELFCNPAFTFARLTLDQVVGMAVKSPGFRKTYWERLAPCRAAILRVLERAKRRGELREDTYPLHRPHDNQTATSTSCSPSGLRHP
jgi:hypothetical protein